VRSTILIASPAAIPILQEQPYLAAADTFLDSAADDAMTLIRAKERPLVVIERDFARSARGEAFINQLNAELKGKGYEMRIVGVRRAERHKLRERILIDGQSATVLDISIRGAHVISLAPVKPRQRVRVSLKDGDRPLTGVAVWVHFELPEEGPRYRAGIEFVPSAQSALADYIAERTR
jgi:hypothetical protein